MRNQPPIRTVRAAILALLGLWTIAMLVYAIASSLPEGGVLLSDDLIAVSPLVVALAIAAFLPRVAAIVLFAYAVLSWISLRSTTNIVVLTIPSIAFGCALFTQSARRIRAITVATKTAGAQ